MMCLSHACGSNPDFVAVPASEYAVVRDTHSEYIERIN